MASPQVSIITPCFNAEKTLPKTVASVQKQTFVDWELILVDDQSSDRTYQTALQLSKGDDRIKAIQLSENGGAAKARNCAIEHAKGTFIAFIDADDCWLPEKLMRQLGAMKEKGWPLSYTAYTRLNNKGETINTVGVPEKLSYRQLLKTNYIGCSTAIYDAQQLGKVYMPELRKRQDYGLWLKILRSTSFAYGINESLTHYLVQEGSLSSQKHKAAAYNWQLYRNQENLSLLKSIYYFSHYAIRGILRDKFPKLAAALSAHYPHSS
tara:strand:+ start:2400 stop:3197 length:798 start_codon:yes stop_codon:yes gene_type:complete